MPFKINGQAINHLAAEKLAHRQDLREDLKNLASVPSTISKLASATADDGASREHVLAILTAAVSASGRLLANRGADAFGVSGISAMERFSFLHFISSQQALFKALQGAILTSDPERHEHKALAGLPKHQENRRVQIRLQDVIDVTMTIEVPFTMAVNPASELAVYFRAQVDCYGTILDAVGVDWGGKASLASCIEAAVHEYKSWAGSAAETSKAVRSFLNFEQQHSRQNIVLDDVTGVSTALVDWIKINDLSEQRRERWTSYREVLVNLPDDKGTMFAESFGVRQVFVQPTATYKVAGTKRENPARVSDVAGLLGTLISDRTQGDELILLCGGPGSGKSTLCRIIASELAKNSDVHPIFLRLRRLQDTQDIASFLEDSLQQEGLINKFSDLAAIPNLVLILDGFDELVMASRNKLREFFSALKDGLSSGPLRAAKAIVSGRDTLFPNGAGLPIGAHVISLLPFDRQRIAAWGAKWRSLHPAEEAKGFYPEKLIRDDKNRGRQAAPLEHLVSWPLTLHLVARAHTSGSINLNTDKMEKIEKAILYRSIVADTALRQENQATGKGRLDSRQMRQFVQAIAWEMHSTGREALDVSEALPVLRTILPTATDSDLSELADVTIVNQPELTKGEESGFEFVHKSFSEYFAAESIATVLEKVCFKGEQWGADEKTWTMSIHDGTRELASLFAVRLLTAEVQEMLEPMLSDFRLFVREGDTAVTEENAIALEKLEQKLKRLEDMIVWFASGKLLESIPAFVAHGRPQANPLELVANYGSALLFIAVALAKRLRKIDPKSIRSVSMNRQAFLRIVHIVQAGDIQIDQSYAERALTHIDVSGSAREGVELIFPPLPPVMLRGVSGIELPLIDAVSSLADDNAALQIELMLSTLILNLERTLEGRFDAHRREPLISFTMHRNRRVMMEYLGRILPESHQIAMSSEELSYRLERTVVEALRNLNRDNRTEVATEALQRAIHEIRELGRYVPRKGPRGHELHERLATIVRNTLLSHSGPTKGRKRKLPVEAERYD